MTEGGQAALLRRLAAAAREGESAWPRGVTTWIRPVVAPVGTVVLMYVLVEPVTADATPLKVTDVGFARPFPKISTVSPTRPAFGFTSEMPTGPAPGLSRVMPTRLPESSQEYLAAEPSASTTAC